MVGDDELQADSVSETRLKVRLDDLTQRPAAGTEALIRVRYPQGVEPLSRNRKVKFQ